MAQWSIGCPATSISVCLRGRRVAADGYHDMRSRVVPRAHRNAGTVLCAQGLGLAMTWRTVLFDSHRPFNTEAESTMC